MLNLHTARHVFDKTNNAIDQGGKSESLECQKSTKLLAIIREALCRTDRSTRALSCGTVHTSKGTLHINTDIKCLD